MKKRKRQRKGYPRLEQRENGIFYYRRSRTDRESLKTGDGVLARQLFEEKKQDELNRKVVQLDKGRRIRLSEFREEYVAMRREMAMKGHLEESTVKSDDLALRRLQDVVGDIPLRSINRQMRERFKTTLFSVAKDKERRKGGIDAYMRSLRAAFNYAVLDEPPKRPYMDRNPFSKQSGSHDRVMFKKGRQLPKALVNREVQAMRNELLLQLDEARMGIIRAEHAVRSRESAGVRPRSEEKWRLREARERFRIKRDLWHLFHWYLFSGIRRKELVTLEWPKVHLDEDMITVLGKGRKERTVPIIPALREIVDIMMPTDPFSRRGPVFPRWRSADYVTQLFSTLARAAGVNHTLHHLRHTHGVQSIMSGIDIVTVRDNMGHADISTTQIYTQVADQHRMDVTRKKLRFGFGGEEENV